MLGWILWNCWDSAGFLSSEIAIWYDLKYGYNVFLSCGIMEIFHFLLYTHIVSNFLQWICIKILMLYNYMKTIWKKHPKLKSILNHSVLSCLDFTILCLFYLFIFMFFIFLSCNLFACSVICSFEVNPQNKKQGTRKHLTWVAGALPPGNLPTPGRKIMSFLLPRSDQL